MLDSCPKMFPEMNDEIFKDNEISIQIAIFFLLHPKPLERSRASKTKSCPAA